ncbi:NinX [Vibrio phage 1.039.O._10N.286.55.A2]|nr:NinX [Vibrio phage 1.039.O._10N.286.55.A2]
MKYEEMIDFEINSAVAKIVTGGDVIEKHDMAEAPTDSGVQVIYKVGVHGEFLDYCNNPSDAWSIIVDNGIGMHKQHNQSWFSSWTTGEFDCVDKNPLRAAMICFLKMKGSENEK